MPSDRVSAVLAAYFKKPYDEYGELALQIKGSGGLTPEEIGLIRSTVLCVDASTIIRHFGCEGQATPSQATSTSNSLA
jgi:hypothetical protein